MINGLLGKKIGMTQVFDENARLVPVTVIEAGPCQVLQVKTDEADEYSAVQLGFEDNPKKINKPTKGHFKKANAKFKKFIKEVARAGEIEEKLSDEVNVGIFEDTKTVDISGISKGRGFQGTVKRWGFSCGPRSHGSMNVRQPGSIGQSADPSRVFKGKKLPGHMGACKKTVKNLKIVKIEKDKNLLYVKGAVPGPNGGFLVIKRGKGK